LRRLPQLVVGLAAALLLLLLGIALLPEPAPEAAPPGLPPSPSPAVASAVALRPSPTRPPRPTPTFSPFPERVISTSGLMNAGDLRELGLEVPDDESLLGMSSAQGGVSLRLIIDDTLALQEEVIEALVVLENRTPERLRIGQRLQLALVDSLTGEELPFITQLSAKPALPNIVRAGERHIQRVRFLVPGSSSSPDEHVTFEFWGVLNFSRDNGVAIEGGRRLEVGPLPLSVRSAPPELQLQAALETDEEAWTLRLTSPDPAAQPPGLLGGVQESASSWYGFGPPGLQLWPSPAGVWSSRWKELDSSIYTSSGDGLTMSLLAIVTAPGYASAVITRTITLGVAPPTPQPVPAPLRFATYEEAQAALPFALADARQVDLAAQLQSVEVITGSHSFDTITGIQVRQRWSLAQGWLRIEQIRGLQVDSAGRPIEDHWYSLDETPIVVAGGEGWAVSQLGIWRLGWIHGDILYHLELPASNFSFEQAVKVAEQLSSG
jgi:hypothetical protein